MSGFSIDEEDDMDEDEAYIAYMESGAYLEMEFEDYYQGPCGCHLRGGKRAYCSHCINVINEGGRA